MDAQSKSKHSSHTCAVCGDTASCYKLYGATTVCYSCRIFFRRTVKSKQELKCVKNGQDLCNFDKATRNTCRKCRYGKCIQIGMNPLLVDSCKQVEKQGNKVTSSQTQENPSQSSRSSVIGSSQLISSHQILITPVNFVPSISSTKTQVEPSTDISLHGFTEESLGKKYTEICDRVLLDPQGVYMKKLFAVDMNCFEQARNKKQKISLPSDYISTSKTIVDSVSVEFLQLVLPSFSAISLDMIASSTSVTLMGLSAGIQECFCNGSMLDQIESCFPYASDFLNFLKSVNPDIDQLKAISLDAMEMMTSPWAPNIEDEEFVVETFQQLNELVCGERVVGQLLYLLSLFSPIDIEMSSEETTQLKQFQSKISMMFYNHVLGQEGMDNMRALEWVGKIGRIIEDLHKCGQIFHQGIIHHVEEDQMEDIESIEIMHL